MAKHKGKKPQKKEVPVNVADKKIYKRITEKKDPNINADPGAPVKQHGASEQLKENEKSDGEQFPGFIFMCNVETKSDCYRYRVFALPIRKLDVVLKINLGTKLFLFDTDSKLLYGVYEATSIGQNSLEPAAFGGKYLAQVKFKIFRDCLPLPESAFRQAIQENYVGPVKFKSELSNEQVEELISLFRPIHPPLLKSPPLFPSSAGSLDVQPVMLVPPSAPYYCAGTQGVHVLENPPQKIQEVVDANPAAPVSNYGISEWQKNENNNKEELSGFIFMCNGKTKPECYRYRVFALPIDKMKVVQKIKLGTKLFLFDTDSKLLYGIYEAACSGQKSLEPAAFGGKYPAQVKFKIFEDCLPVPESAFRHVIQENYVGHVKFKSELSNEQVKELLSLFHSIAPPPLMHPPYVPQYVSAPNVQQRGPLPTRAPNYSVEAHRALALENPLQSIQEPCPNPSIHANPAAPVSNHGTSEWKKENDGQQFSGFIFMCNGKTKPECYRNHVFALPIGKMDVVKKINVGTKLFLFDTDLKLLYGIYEATSSGQISLEPAAFGGRYPAQVRFKILKDCLPLPESAFRKVIQENYVGRFKFKSELTDRQVKELLSLFCPSTPLPLTPMSPSVGTHHVQTIGLPYPSAQYYSAEAHMAQVHGNPPESIEEPYIRSLPEVGSRGAESEYYQPHLQYEQAVVSQIGHVQYNRRIANSATHEMVPRYHPSESHWATPPPPQQAVVLEMGHVHYNHHIANSATHEMVPQYHPPESLMFVPSPPPHPPYATSCHSIHHQIDPKQI